MNKTFVPHIVCIGGTTRPGSSTEKALRYVAQKVEALGATAEVFAGSSLLVPIYTYTAEKPERTPQAQRIVNAMRSCHGLILSSPGYHGSYSGLVKNVLDYAEDLASDSPPFLEGKAVGSIASAYGWQAIGTTLVGLRSVVHSLRGWNSPRGVGINSMQKLFDEEGQIVLPEVRRDLDEMASQVVELARMRAVWLESK